MHTVSVIQLQKLFFQCLKIHTELRRFEIECFVESANLRRRAFALNVEVVFKTARLQQCSGANIVHSCQQYCSALLNLIAARQNCSILLKIMNNVAPTTWLYTAFNVLKRLIIFGRVHSDITCVHVVVKRSKTYKL